jgi:hypothetical protein
MIKPKLYSRPPKTNYEFQDGESIEDKVRRITENNEPITDGAPIMAFLGDQLSPNAWLIPPVIKPVRLLAAPLANPSVNNCPNPIFFVLIFRPCNFTRVTPITR